MIGGNFWKGERGGTIEVASTYEKYKSGTAQDSKLLNSFMCLQLSA